MFRIVVEISGKMFTVLIAQNHYSTTIVVRITSISYYAAYGILLAQKFDH